MILFQAQLEKLQKEIAHTAKKTGISSAARLALLSSIVPKKETVSEENILTKVYEVGFSPKLDFIRPN